MVNRDVRLSLHADNNLSGRRIVFRRGGIAIRDFDAFRFNDQLSSFRLRNVVDSNAVTLILFADNNFRGATRVYRGNTVVNALGDFNDQASSLIVVGRRLNDNQVARIIANRRPPLGILFVRS
ncbi:hypothetical protein [Paenibacillus sp.]|uniref:hypothetical protein n=1 Tax=Paenibacillus sp. TaxID=58172 RepID=UPI002811BD35|nr:hypothetical protein [Paenibacillus sp.]